MGALRLTFLLLLYGVLPSCDAKRSSLDYHPAGESPLLYRAGIDKVMNLDAETFYDTVLNSSTPMLVELYKDWCGHCRKFSATYRSFAKSVENWRDVIAVAAINCADLHNRPQCRDAQRVGKKTVPSVKFFPAGAHKVDEESEFDPPNRTVEAMRAALVKTLMKVNVSSIDNIQAFFGNGSAVSEERIQMDELLSAREDGNASISSYLDALWSSSRLAIPSNISFLVLVFEDANATFDSNGSNMTMGVQLTLDLSPYTDAIRVLSLFATSAMSKLLKLTKFPSVAMFGRLANDSACYQEPLYTGEASFNATKELVRLAGLEPVGAQKPDPDRDEWRPRMINCKKEPERCKKLYYVAETDMLRAVRMALYNEVLNRDVINETHFGNLKAFVELLIQHFPTKTKWGAPRAGMEVPMTDSENAHAFFESLSAFLDNHTVTDGNTSLSNGSFTAEEWNTTFLALESVHHSPFPRYASWEHCKGTTQEYRGFTCGLWSLFHAMTVNAYLHKGPDFDPTRPLKTIRGWVDSYFSCHSCRVHFLEKTRELYPLNRTNVGQPEDVFLYLWRIHNLVNRDLAGDYTEDPQFKKYQFPPEFLCPHCYTDVGCFHTDGGKRPHVKEWDEWGVKEFFLSYYTQIKPHHEYAAAAKRDK